MRYDATKNTLPEAVGVSLRRADNLVRKFIEIYENLDEPEYSKNRLYELTAKHVHTIGEAYFMGSYIEWYISEMLQ